MKMIINIKSQAMLLCVCRAVSDRTVRALVREQGCSAADVSRRTGCGTSCGACVGDLRRIVEEELTARDAQMAAK